jgi:hypothetical protein
MISKHSRSSSSLMTKGGVNLERHKNDENKINFEGIMKERRERKRERKRERERERERKGRKRG